MMPMVFCASFVPWPRLKAAEEASWPTRKNRSTRKGLAFRKTQDTPIIRSPPDDEADDRREDDEDRDLDEAARDQGPRPGLGQPGAGQAPDERVGDADREPVVRAQVRPEDRPHEGGEDEDGAHDAGVDDAPADGVRHVDPEAEGGREVEEGRPGHGQARRQDPRRHDGGDGVRRVVHPVDEVEGEGEQDDEDREGQHGAPAPQALLMTTLPRAWVKSVQASQASSRPS